MTDQSTEESRVQSLDDRFAAIEEKLERLLSGGSSEADPEPDEPEADPKAEMRAELAKLQAAEKRKQAREQKEAATEGRFKAIEEKLAEKPPREYKRSTRFMRWQGDDDK